MKIRRESAMLIRRDHGCSPAPQPRALKYGGQNVQSTQMDPAALKWLEASIGVDDRPGSCANRSIAPERSRQFSWSRITFAAWRFWSGHRVHGRNRDVRRLRT